MKSESRILFEYPDHQIEIEWNGSATFNVFTGGRNVNCFTDNNCRTMEQAQKSADEWLEEQLQEEMLDNVDSN
jgi:pyruvate-formate lyase-activating enzyme